MAEALKNQFGPDVPHAICHMVKAVHPAFDGDAFVQDALAGYDALALMPRGQHIAHALKAHLPADFEQAIAILVASLDQPHGRDAGLSLASFLFLPHTQFVATFKTVDLAAGETLHLSKRLSLADRSTRKHYPGTHRVELLLNGAAHPLGAFELR
ncbi:MAG: hypothetical protein WAV85_16790 [Rhodoferax sp.]